MMTRNARVQPYSLPRDKITNEDCKDCFEIRKNEMNNDASKCPIPEEDKHTCKKPSYHGRRRYCSPLRVFDWFTLAVCFLVSVEAHIELYWVINQDTCPSVQEQL